MECPFNPCQFFEFFLLVSSLFFLLFFFFFSSPACALNILSRFPLRFMGHSADWADYSMGIRLVAEAVVVDGRPMNLSAVLADPELAQLLSDEGPIVPSRVPILPRPAPNCWQR